MKIKTTIIMLVLLCSVKLSAQDQSSLLSKRLSISAENQPLSTVLKQIEEKGNLTLTYSSETIDADRKVSIRAIDTPLNSILSEIFAGTFIRFRVMENKVLLYPTQEKSPELVQTVRGTVVDPESNQPIIGANIIILGSEPLLGASTDMLGRFKIEKVPVGRHNFKVTFMGFKPKVLSNIIVDSGKEVVLEIGLEESVTRLEEVVVTAELDKSVPLNEMALTSAKSFTVEETSRYAGSFNDPARMAASYAGVAGSTDDAENSIIIRGNSPRGLLWRLEGMEVPNPNHFAEDGSSSGAISMLNSNVLANSDFLTGAFPAEYGNAFSGVFDLKMRSGNNEKREYAIQAGLLGVDASFEGPIRRKKNTDLSNPSYLINYRYSTLTMLEAIGLDIAEEGEQVPAFQDLAFKLRIPTRSLGTFSIYGLGGISEVKELNERLILNQLVPLKEGDKYKMGMVGLSNIVNVSKRSFLETSLTQSRTRYEYLYETAALTDNEQDFVVFNGDTEDYTNDVTRFSATLSTKFNARHTTKVGFIYSDLHFDLSSEGRDTPNTVYYRSNENNGFGMVQGFVSHKMNLTDQLTMTGGFHYMRLDLAGQDSFEPRFGLKWQFASNQSLSFGFGVHSRREETSLYFTELIRDGLFWQPNTNLGLAKARHFVVGYDRNFGSDFHLKLEAYYQDLYNIPVSANPNSHYSSLNQEDAFQRLPLVNEGGGENYGIELTFEKFLSRGYFFLLTGSLYDSKYSTLSGEKFNTRYSGLYNTSFVVGREFNLSGNDRQKTLNIGIETVLAGGARSTAIDVDASRQAGRTVYVANQPFGQRLKDYARIDFQIALKTNRKKVTHELKLDIQNLTSRSNIVGEWFNPVTDTVTASSFTGELIPVLSYKVIF